jgi:MurNAc alpha-1-phosphate uridylyltransferase
MRPLTDDVPKPLLVAGGRRLIEWQLDRLARAGIRDIVVNVAHLPEQFEAVLRTGEGYGVTLSLSREGRLADDALETLGGIVRALPLLGGTPFVVVSGDIVTDFDYATLQEPAAAIAAGAQTLTWFSSTTRVPFARRHGLCRLRIDPDAPVLTYANIGAFAPRLFDGLQPVRARLSLALRSGTRGARDGEHFADWYNVDAGRAGPPRCGPANGGLEPSP